MTLAQILTKLRKQSGLNMSQVTRNSGRGKSRLTQGYISRLESGKEDNPSMAKIISLALIYDVDPNTIVGWKGGRP